jgi:hypothetical protein
MITRESLFLHSRKLNPSVLLIQVAIDASRTREKTLNTFSSVMTLNKVYFGLISYAENMNRANAEESERKNSPYLIPVA